jgi:hypothetical protein
VNRGQFKKGNTFGSSSAAILGRKRTRMEKECDTSNDTSPFDITPLILGAKRERRAPMTLSQEPLRDCTREPQSQKREQIGVEKMKTMKAREESATKTRTAAAYATKLKLARQGLTCFGSMELLLFQKKAEDRFGTIMPALLEDFPCCARIMHYCKPILDIVFAFVVRCFVEYEKTIAILEKNVRRLQRGERRRPVVDSNFTPNEVDSYSSRTTLWRHANAVKDCIRLHAGNCDVKAITIAKQVVSLLTPTPETTINTKHSAIELQVNAAIVESIHKFYDELRLRHQGDITSQFCVS